MTMKGVALMANTKLEKLYTVLNDKIDQTIYNYTVPDLWNVFDYQGEECLSVPNHEIMVNPYRFFSTLINDVFLKNYKNTFNPSISLSRALNLTPKRNVRGGEWLKSSVMYSTMIRASSAWDSDRSGKLEDENIYHFKETGTFVKMLAMLPLLSKMGVNTVYLLPISKFSLKDKKGDLGSPYGISNFNELDPNLKDSLTGDAMTLDEEFEAFVEACHILNMRVMIDIIPRTNAVENDLIRDYPEWFYWIKASEADDYKVPEVEGFDRTVTPKFEYMEKVYQSPSIQKHIARFQFDPKTQNPTLWEKVRKRKNLMAAIEKAFDLKVAPAFSDYINDIQPPWTDITFFRMYLDHPKETRQYLKDPENTPPYILYDTIKSNMYHGDKPNLALWKKLANIIPSYQKRFGIDGARIDMGHALPAKLIQMIFNEARKIDADFGFIAEELDPKNAKQSRDVGYNIIIGNGFMMIPRIWEGKAKEFYYEMRHLKAPVFAGAETHDTPRIAARDGGETLALTTTIVNMFMPNGVPFINSAQEVFEKQMMNTGLDCTDKDKYNLSDDDPYQGKLALFDRYQFHYTHPKRWVIPDVLDFIKPFRKKYLTQITNPKYFVPIYDDYPQFVGYGFYKNTKSKKGNVLMVLANLNPYHEVWLKPSIFSLREASKNQENHGKLLLSTHEPPRSFTQFHDHHQLDLHLGAGEVKIVEF